MRRVAFRIKASLDHRALAVALVSALAEDADPGDDDFRIAVTTAFGEAFNNVVLHSYRDRRDGVLDVEAELACDRLTLNLMDTGIAADFDGVEPPDLDAMPEGGLGVYMMHALVDEITYRGGSPNVLSMTKRINGGRGGASADPGSAK